MTTIFNTTAHSIKVPLPHGKVLHLGPRKTGKITAKAVDHPPIAKLVETGDLEMVGDSDHANPAQTAVGSIRASNRSSHPAVSSQRRGDR